MLNTNSTFLIKTLTSSISSGSESGSGGRSGIGAAAPAGSEDPGMPASASPSGSGCRPRLSAPSSCQRGVVGAGPTEGLVENGPTVTTGELVGTRSTRGGLWGSPSTSRDSGRRGANTRVGPSTDSRGQGATVVGSSYQIIFFVKLNL